MTTPHLSAPLPRIGITRLHQIELLALCESAETTLTGARLDAPALAEATAAARRSLTHNPDFESAWDAGEIAWAPDGAPVWG